MVQRREIERVAAILDAAEILLAERGYAAATLKAIGDIHWAGSETASDHPGYLDGAIEAGERATTEVIEALARIG